MSQPNGSPRFDVATSKKVLDELKAIVHQSKQGKTLLKALIEINARLETDARIFGEPLYTLKHLQLEVRLGAVSPLAIEYGVHHTKNLVIVRRFTEMFLKDG